MKPNVGVAVMPPFLCSFLSYRLSKSQKSRKFAANYEKTCTISIR